MPPEPSAFFSDLMFLAFAATKHQISSHCRRRTRTLRTFLWWYSPHAAPRSTNSFVTVLIETSARRLVARRHPGLIIGQMQRRLNDYRYLARHLVKVRRFVLPGSIADGWGQVVPVTL